MRGRRSEEQNNEPVPVAGRVPPHDLDAEAAVLSAVLLERDALDRIIDILKPEHFYSDANRRIYEAATQLAIEGTPIDITTVASWLRSREWMNQIGGASYLAQLVDATPAIAHVSAHARIVFEKWRCRQTIGLCQRTAAMGYGAEDTQVLLDEHSTALHALATAQTGAPMQPLGSNLMSTLERDHKRQQQGISMMGRRSGIDPLDNKLTGFHPGDLYIVAARPGMGKTSLAMQIAVTVATPQQMTERLFEDPVEYGVPVFSLEMPREQLQTRMVCNEGWTDLRKYRAGQLDQADWDRVFRAGATLSPLPIWIDDTAGINVPQIRAKVRQIQASWCRPAQRSADGKLVSPERKVGAIVLDYLQLVGSHGEGKSREEIVASISRELKKMAKDLKAPVIALSQLSRAVETRGKDKRPQLSDLRESGAIEQDADAILFLYRDEYYNPANATAKNICEIIIAKQRNGPTGKVLARFDGFCTRFGNLSAADAQAYSSDDDNE
jgi:replicative DNA helicase